MLNKFLKILGLIIRRLFRWVKTEILTPDIHIEFTGVKERISVMFMSQDSQTGHSVTSVSVFKCVNFLEP